MTYSDGTNSGFSRRNHYVGQPAVKVGSSNFDYYRKPEKSHGFAKRVAFFAYFPLLILWLETDLKIASGFDVLGGFAFTFLFTIVISAVLVLLCSFSKRRGVNRGIAILCVFFRTFSSFKAVCLILCFEVYLYSIQALKRRLFRASLPQMFYPIPTDTLFEYNLI